MAEDEHESAYERTLRMLRETRALAKESVDGAIGRAKEYASIAKSFPPKRKTTEDHSSRLGRLKSGLGEKFRNLAYGEPKTRFEPEYSEVEKREREEMRGALGGLEGYNPKESKGPGFLKKMVPYAERMFGKTPEKGKLSDYVELADTEGGEPNVAVEDRESLKKAFGRLEKYAPGQTYEEPIAKSANAAGTEVYLKRIHGKYREPAVKGITTTPAKEKRKPRKSYGLEAYEDGLLGRRKINDIDQYAPEHSGRKPGGVKEAEQPVMLPIRKSLKNEFAADSLLKPRGLNEVSQYAQEHTGRKYHYAKTG